MKKKILALVLCIALVASVAVGLSACNKDNQAGGDNVFKVGFIFLHGEESTYDKNFIDAAKEVQAKLGLSNSQVIFKTDIDESNECYEAAADLVDQGCDVIFADSFGHEDYMIRAAKEFPNVQFCHATGTKAHTENLANYHNAFASIYEGRYLAGIAAGMKLNQMIDAGDITANQAKMGYVGAFPYAEVVSGYTSFFLGARSVCPTVTMSVSYTSSWYDETAERETAKSLIDSGCVLISQHADSMGAPTACETAGVPNVSYNGSTLAQCPTTFIVSSRINWAPYFEYMIINSALQVGFAKDWCGGIAEDSVVLSDVNAAVAAPGTAQAIEAAKAKFLAGTLNVFDTNTFTVDGKKLESYLADVDTDAAFTPDTEVISNGVFQESKFRSAPYFDLRIDGITELNN